LVAVAILMVLYFLDVHRIFGPGLSGRSSVPESRPWLEEDLIKGPGEEIRMPKAPKPQLDEQREITAAVSREGAERGTMELTFGADGRVRGTWGCAYRHGNQDYTYDSSFAGNIDAKKVFVSAEGTKDKSLLYFIARGPYTQRMTNVNNGQTTTEEGTIWVTGWLGADYSARGLITITTDNTWSVTYDWQSSNAGETGVGSVR
ncbi:MAG: hypothetical protein ACOYLD_12625, partial [Anaerohalosphaeraceae bacterium]